MNTNSEVRRAVCLWGGGKDACLALFRAMNHGYSVERLFNVTLKGSGCSISHNLGKEAIVRQAEAMGIKLLQKDAERNNARDIYVGALSSLKDEGINYAIFGDIFVREHYDWLSDVSAAAGVNPVFPLWKEDTDKLAREFIGAGFKSMIINVKADKLDKSMLGRTIDNDFLSELPAGVDPCGENGEYHSFVFNGPIFSRELKIQEGAVEKVDDRWVLNIKVY